MDGVKAGVSGAGSHCEGGGGIVDPGGFEEGGVVGVEAVDGAEDGVRDGGVRCGGGCHCEVCEMGWNSDDGR